MSILLFFLIAFLSVAAWTDWRYRRIPNALIIPSFLLALILNTLTRGIDGLGLSIIGLATGFGLLIIPFLFGGIGAGDVKLLMVIGSFGGLHLVIYSFFLGALTGAIISLGIYLFSFVKNKKIKTMPYGIPLALGTLVYILGNGRL